jgi:hypothetical protein
MSYATISVRRCTEVYGIVSGWTTLLTLYSAGGCGQGALGCRYSLNTRVFSDIEYLGAVHRCT